MKQRRWRILVLMACAAALAAILSACSRQETPTPVAVEIAVATSAAPTLVAPTPPAPISVVATPVAQSVLPTPLATHVPGNDESVILIMANGDVVLYQLADRLSLVLLEQAYTFDEGDRPLWAIFSYPLRPSPDGKWLLVPTPDNGTWLVATDGSTQRQISPTPMLATWSPDSQHIAYIGAQSSDASSATPVSTPAEGDATGVPNISVLYTQNIVAEEEPYPLLESEARLYQPTWSPGCATTPAPSGSSCGQHIFVFLLQSEDFSIPSQAALVDVTSGELTQLGPYAGPARETVPFEFRWSPTGDEFWVPGPSTMDTNGIAYQTDGSAPRPLVMACDANCIWPGRSGEFTTEGGWKLSFMPGSPDGEITAQSPTGEEFEVAAEAYFAGTLTSLGSTEVGRAEAEVVPLVEALPASDWTEYEMPGAGVRYRLPPSWVASGPAEGMAVQNYHFVEPVGMAALGDGALNLFIRATPYDGAAATFQEWLDSNGAEPTEPLPGVVLNEYDRRYYGVEGEVITFADRPAARLHSTILPYAETIVVPLDAYVLTITIWPRPATPDPTLEEILASFELAGEGE